VGTKEFLTRNLIKDFFRHMILLTYLHVWRKSAEKLFFAVNAQR